jgi:hypothetical protein
MYATIFRLKALRLAAAMAFTAMLLAGSTLLLSSCALLTATTEGTWSGVVSDTYFCEGGSFPIEIEITDTAIVVTGGSAFTVGTTGSLTHQSGEAYTVSFDLGTAGEGQFYVDPLMNWGLLVVHTSSASYNYVVGVLQKGALGPASFVENDLVGDWKGSEFRVDANLTVTSTSASSATVTSPAGLHLEGTDGDGNFSGDLALDDGTVGVYTSPGFVLWPGPPLTLYVLGTLSPDKQVFAVAFLTSLCEYNLDTVLPEQKFAIWVRQ